MTEKKIQSTEYNPALQPLVDSLYNEPINKGSAFGYYAENEPESTMDVMNAHSNQIMNKTVTTLYRMADTLYGPFMPEEAREQLQLEIEQMREDYIDTENSINRYLYNNTNGAELVGLSVAGMLYRGFADPVNQAINLGLGGSGFFVNLLADGTQYMADTSFYENRNILTDPKVEDIANIGMNAAISYGTMKMQGKYADITDKMLYEDTGKFNKTNLQWENPRLEDKYLIDVNNPDEFLSTANSVTALAPLDRLMRVNQDNSDLLEVMKQRGYDIVVNTKDVAEVGKRTIYGQPQGDYTSYKDYGIKQDIGNFVDSISRMNKKLQEELYEVEDTRNSSISTETEVTHAIKPLATGYENALDYYYGQYARELSEITGFNSSTGDMIYKISKTMPKETLVEMLYNRTGIMPTENGYSIVNFLKNQFEDYSKSLDLNEDYHKAVMYEKLYGKNEHQAKVRRAYEKQDIETIRKIGQFVGKKVELTEAEAQAAGLPFDNKKINKTLEKGQGSYRDFEPEIKKFKNKIKNYVKKEKELNTQNINKEIDELKEIYKQKTENIRSGKENIKTERKILKEEIKGVRQNKNISIEEEHKKVISEKEKINSSYREQIKSINSEKDTKTKELKNKIKEIRKVETAELNKIQNNNKLYDPDKLPLARKIQRKNSKEIRKLKNDISGIEKEYSKKISELEKKQNSKIEILVKKEAELKKAFDKGMKEYSNSSEKAKNKFIRRNKADIEREIKKLQSEYEREEAGIYKKYKGKDYNKYRNMQSKLRKINEKNYKNFYKHFKEYEDNFSEIKSLKDLTDNDGRYIPTNTYSIDENPLEMARAFYNDMSRTNRDSRKQINIGNFGNVENPKIQEATDYRNVYYIAEKWGNKINDGDNPVDNFIKSAYGNEKETYEIITDILSDNAEQKAGINEIRQLISNLSVEDGKYSRDFNLSQQFGMKGLTGENRKYAIEALTNMLNKNSTSKRIGPDFWYDPKKKAINSRMTRRAFKGLMSIKFLGNLNYLREIPQNNFRLVSGARKLGWNKEYSIMKDFTDGIKTTYQLAKQFNNLKNNTLDDITDPVVRRRAELWIDKKLANSIVYNIDNGVSDLIHQPKTYLLQLGQKAIDSTANKMAAGQSVSDIQRISNAEFASLNYMLDILPTANSPLLSKILKNNGIEEGDFNILNSRIKELGEEGLMKLVFSGERPTNSVDYRIKSLFEQFSDVMGKEFNAYQRHDSIKETGSFLSDTLYMFKRYSLGAVDGFVTNLTTYIDADGTIRKSFYPTGDFKFAYKDMLRGINFNNALPFLYSSVSGALIYNVGIKYAQGKLFGGTDDERAEAKFESLTSIDGLLNFTFSSLIDNALNVTGVGIVMGGSTVLGSFYDMAIARAKRAYSSDNLNDWEKLGLWGACLWLPEPAARGIDSIKFEKNIPNRITTFSSTEKDIWRFDKKIDAELEQLEGKLPYEKIKDIDWLSHFKKRPQKAREITGSPDNMPDEVVVVGAAGLAGVMEQTAETVAITEQMSEPKEMREKNLRAMGLDIDSLLSRMELADVRNFNAAVSFMKIRDEEELLMCAYSYLKSKDKKGFIDSMMTDDEKMFFNAYKDNIQRNRKKINSSVSKERGIDNYIKSLDIINEYATGQIN